MDVSLSEKEKVKFKVYELRKNPEAQPWIALVLMLIDEKLKKVKK